MDGSFYVKTDSAVHTPAAYLTVLVLYAIQIPKIYRHIPSLPIHFFPKPVASDNDSTSQMHLPE